MYHKSITAKVLIPLGREKTIDRTTTKYIFGCQKRQPNEHLVSDLNLSASTPNTYMYLFDFNFREKIDTLVMCTHKLTRIVMLLFYAINTIYTLLPKNQRENNGGFSWLENKRQPNTYMYFRSGVPA